MKLIALKLIDLKLIASNRNVQTYVRYGTHDIILVFILKIIRLNTGKNKHE